tara:strand:- start:1071 stop:1769 length:699 start_codon:yes stop_codon:yes gene_type:complete
LIKGKKILITGISSGLGKSLSSILIQNKNKIYSLGKSAVKNKSIKYVKCNFKNINSIHSKLKKLIDTKKIDYVFLNAGILGKIDKIEKLSLKDLNEVFKINVFANKKVIDFLIKKKIKTKLIVAISSGAAIKPKLGWHLYCSSKAAFKFLIESYANEHKDRKFVSIAPGLIKTNMQKQICKVNENKISSVKKFKMMNKKNLIPTPEEVAKNIIKSISVLKIESGQYFDIRKK